MHEPSDLVSLIPTRIIPKKRTLNSCKTFHRISEVWDNQNPHTWRNYFYFYLLKYTIFSTSFTEWCFDLYFYCLKLKTIYNTVVLLINLLFVDVPWLVTVAIKRSLAYGHCPVLHCASFLRRTLRVIAHINKVVTFFYAT